MHENLTAFGGFAPPPESQRGAPRLDLAGGLPSPRQGQRNHRSWETLSPNFERWGTGGGSKYIFDVLCASNKKYILNIYSMRYFTFWHCCLIWLGGGKHLDVIITIMKHVQCSGSCPPQISQRWGGVKNCREQSWFSIMTWCCTQYCSLFGLWLVLELCNTGYIWTVQYRVYLDCFSG